MDWTLETIMRALGQSPPSGLPRFPITSVQLMPDQCSPGTLFVPLPYDLLNRGFTNEAEAIAAAIDNGASVVMTNPSQLPLRPTVPVIHAMPDVLSVLKRLAQFARSNYQGKVIAITGSVGKTTTKDLVHHVLSHSGSCFKTLNNQNTIGGICATMINRPDHSQYTVVEIGASQRGHLQHASIARPHIGIVTNVGISHLGSYRSPDEILHEKVSLFDHLQGDRIGLVHKNVLDASDALMRSKQLSRLVTVGEADSDIHVIECTFNGIASEGMMSIFGKPHRFRLSLPGRHFVNSAMFAMGVASVLKLDIDSLLPMLATIAPSARRFERYRVAAKGNVMEVIDDSFNASPASVSALLSTLEQRTAARKVFVFGDMYGFGDETVRLHQAIGPLVRQAGIDLLITVGKWANHAGGTCETVNFADAATASCTIPLLLKPWDLVAIKGSGENSLDKVVSAVRSMGDSTPAVSWKIEDEWARS